MGTERLSMRKVREILRLKWVGGYSHREVARSLGVSAGKVAETVSRARALEMTWEAVEGLGEDELERRLYGPRLGPGVRRPPPDCSWVHTELRRPGVTLELLHLEYLERHREGYRYSRFCELYHRWVRRQGVTMRQVHRAGEKCFVDYSGKKVPLVDPGTGEVREAELFVAALGASSLTYAEASWTQRSADWIQSHTRALEYFGGVPRAVVPDQLRSGVSAPCRYEPGVQRTYEEWAAHYGTVVLPARPYRARDKAKVEAAVQVAQRWILARLRHETFFSLAALNERIGELLEDLNGRRMRAYGASRRELFERMERAALQPLPPARFAYAEWKRVRVNIDYHVEVDRHYYSVPFALVHEEAEARVTATTVEVFHRGQRVASHARSYEPGRHTTVPEHMPRAHRAHLEWTPTRLVHWAQTVGEKTAALVEAILRDRPHPEQGYRSCLGILRLARSYGAARLEAACARALLAGARSYHHVDSILKNGLDRLPAPGTAPPARQGLLFHENVRGRDYYTPEEGGGRC